MLPPFPASSAEFLYFNGIQAFDLRSPDAAADPTTLPVLMTLVTIGDDLDDAVWTAGEWFDTATARILIGAGGAITPLAGTWDVGLTITGAIEQPKRVVGQLTVV